ncbi:MAG TPA: winged helix-turn-helix domain-containing protein [Tepidiformaceae bacterium]|nr:winged helix-turn-helix domain-containing protein [Tepidiformaceae bacterium]
METPALRAAVAYFRPFERESLLAGLANLGVFVVEQQGRWPATTISDSVDLVILVCDGHDDLEVVRKLAHRGPIVVAIVPTTAVVAECIAAGANICMADGEFIEAPRQALAVAARMARQRKSGTHDGPPMPRTIAFGGVVFSSESCSLHNGRRRVPLSRTERDVLLCLAEDPGVPVRSEVLASAARIGMFPSSRYLGSVIVRLRRKLRQLGADGAALATVHGVGYVLLAPSAGEEDAQ